MIECNGVRLNIHPSSATLREIRELVYNRGEYNTLNEEDKIGEIVDWFANHGNACFELGQKFGEKQ